MDQDKSLSPAPLFMLLMILGNFMLLNLFLAILLKSISSAPAEDGSEGAAEGAEAAEEAAPEPKSPESPRVKSPEPAPEAGDGKEGRKPTEEMLCSSCSNVEEEFE